MLSAPILDLSQAYFETPPVSGIATITAVPIVDWSGTMNGIANAMIVVRPATKRSSLTQASCSNHNPAGAYVLLGRGLLL